MLGWALGFFVAAVIAGAFGFGLVASTFAGIAVILFWVFVALFVISLLFNLAPRGEGAVGGGGNGFALVAIIAVIAIFSYAWVKNDWSAQQVGAAIDQTASKIADNTTSAIDHASDRATDVAQDTGNTIRRDTDNNPNNDGPHN